ncbi:hypothetical protein Tco_0488939 [Tanacetum coccineum]
MDWVEHFVRLQAEEIKLEYSSRSSKIFSRNTGLHSYHFSLFLLVGNIVTNSRVTPSWREIVSLTFSEAGVLHVNWISFGHCVKHMELEPEIRVPGLECTRSLTEGVPFVNNMVIEEPEYGMFFIDVNGDEAF